MLIKDQSGLILSGASASAAENYDTALQAYYCYAGDPVTALGEALADSPGFVMGHVLTAYMNLLGGNAEGMAAGVVAFESAATLKGTDRERGHVEALSCIVRGELKAAGRVLEDVAVDHPRDGLALQAGQLIDFLVGDSRMLRDRIARALPAWSPSQPDYHAILGMLAFGLEETGHYARAEAAGRKAIELQPRNGWAQHAVAHVLEMQDRRAEGVAFMRADIRAWTEESFFQVHNWWHLGLFHLGLGETDEALRLYDGPIYGDASDLPFDMVDAAAMLWRLKLRGVDAGARWDRLADVYDAKRAGFGMYAFDDAHAMMAYVGAGRTDGQKVVLEAQARALTGGGDNVEFVGAVGLPVIQALQAFGEADYGRACDLLRGVRGRAARFGGSHAQRDLIDLTIIEAAVRGGDASLEQALRNERLAARPDAPGEAPAFARAA